jgi:hypothetical protein
MFLTDKLTDTTAAQSPVPPEWKHIRIWPDLEAKLLRIDPQGTISSECRKEIARGGGFTGPVREAVEWCEAVCQRHGWETISRELNLEQLLDGKPTLQVWMRRRVT